MGYYREQLAAERLRRCYELAPPRAQAYLEAEIGFVLEHCVPSSRVLELGCGYGRVLGRLCERVQLAVGVDTSLASLRLAHKLIGGHAAIRLAAMDALSMGFPGRAFDLTVCVQNGISAFACDRRLLVAEAVRVTRSGGSVVLSSYAERFWDARLEWFEAQAAHGLIGEIDPEATRDGVIVCRDGFRATTVSAAGFAALAAEVGLAPRVFEVAGSSLFCELVVR
jgi:SAM-dependent methyltransferase